MTSYYIRRNNSKKVGIFFLLRRRQFTTQINQGVLLTHSIGEKMLNKVEVAGLWDACIAFREAKAGDLSKEFNEILELVVLYIDRWIAGNQNNPN